MRYFRAFLMTLGMFSAIPAPENIWDADLMPMMLPCLPVIGALIGAVWYGVALLLGLAGFSPMIQSAAVMLAPFILCGFIHAEGYMDTADAVFSRRSAEEKKRILKDPHAGAFGVIALAVLFLLQFCAVFTFVSSQSCLIMVVFIPILSRCAAGAATLNCRAMSDTGYAALFKQNTKPRHTVFICVLAVIAAVLAWYSSGSAGLIILFTEVLAGVLAAAWLYRQFGGLSGDLGGFIITVSELAGVLCLAVLA